MEAHNKTETASGPWNPERVELIKRTICPKGIGEDEFALFIEQCKRSGLDPLLKEAFCVARRQNAGNRERPNWVTRYEFQPSEAGMLARAERFPDFKGIQASAVYAEDDIIVDQGKGEVVHRFNPAKRKGSLVGAWARVVREGKLPVVVWLDFAGYVQQTPLWAKIPTTMIEKCARVAALRKAYPEAFGGLYVREEMPAEEFEPQPEPGPLTGHGGYEVLGARPGPMKASFPPLPTAPREAREEKEPAVAQAPQAPETPRETVREPEPAVESVKARPSARSAKDVREPAAKETAPAAEPAPAAEAPAKLKSSSVVVAFGPHKGKTASELSDEELAETIDLAHEKLMEQPKAKWARAMRENLAALETEAELRCRVPAADDAKA
ncbi:phage recombination protein Bet [Vitiosangium sp. GDMCC 1.1324]|uniref:phage recombination protein Bet n=1 Tax=Vitiosangium sp. (strain GDMCC 1.1324) TaxID=2138576 RepID=UPI000D3824D1|nr:phage recombination protein Bet [Vitiosangium sp. GDMCC 1.1324]PTL77634.1 phage recombination protein Bet [Vitiosangium sp. GDMCC 1.1324]